MVRRTNALLLMATVFFAATTAFCDDTAEDLLNSGLLKARLAVAGGAGGAKAGRFNAYGDFSAALASYNEAIRLKPDYAEAYFNRGLVRARLDLGGAIEDYSRAIQIKPDYAEAYFNRGVAKEFNNDNAGEIIKDYDEAIRFNPAYAEAYVHRAGVKEFNLKDACGAIADYTTAISLYNKAIKLQPNSPEAYKGRGDAKQCCTRYLGRNIISDYDRAIKLRPDYTDAYMGRAQAILQNGVFSYPRTNAGVAAKADMETEAAKKVATALRTCPNRPEVADLLYH